MKFFPFTILAIAFSFIALGFVVLYKESGWIQGAGYALIVLGFYIGAAFDSVEIERIKGDEDGT